MKNPIAIARPSYSRGEKWAKRYWLILFVAFSLLGLLFSYIDRTIVITMIIGVIAVTILGGAGVLTGRRRN